MLIDLSKTEGENAPFKLNQNYDIWRGKHEQLDDVLVVGINIS